MFLAFNEIKHSLFRYSLVSGVIFLIAYLVFFLSGLAFGLAEDNRTAVDKWQADFIILTDDANDNLNMSMIPLTAINKVAAKEKAILLQTPGVITKVNQDDNLNVAFFGIKSNQFLKPNISAGKMYHAKNEVVVDNSLNKEHDIQLNNRLAISGNNTKLKVVGFTDNAKYNTLPVIYTSTETFQEIRYENLEAKHANNLPVNALVVRGTPKNVPSSLKSKSLKDFINKIPGYSAQVLTFGFMISFLIVIAAIVIGIFIYVLTMQKIDIFGVMKAQGVSNRYISKSVIYETFILATVAVCLGAILTLITAVLLPNKVPFTINLYLFIGISILMVLFAILGALFSVRTITKIDPLKAIG